jgi:hypothetical protein
MKKLIFVFAGVLLGFVLFHMGEGFLDAMAHDGSPAARERRLVEISNEMNRTLPREAGEMTRLERTSAGPGLQFTYYYKFIDHSAAEIDPTKLTATVKAKSIDRYRTSQEMSNFRKWQVELHHKYYGKDGIEITTIIVGPHDL